MSDTTGTTPPRGTAAEAAPADTAPAQRGAAAVRSRRWALYAPLALAGGAFLGFYALLRGMGTGSYDPRGLPSALIGQPVPDFTLPPLEGAEPPAFSAADLRGGGLPKPVLINFWASWCVPCIVEHPMLVRLSREGTPVFGINYKDKPGDAAAFLRRHGNPYARLGVDQPGRVAIDWGVYGVPETYLVDRTGIVRWRWAGPITPQVLENDLQPLLRRYA